MSKMFKLEISPSNYSFPYDISLFTETVQGVFSLLSQILGLEDDKTITKIMVGIVCLVSQSTKEFNLSSNGKTFNYHTLLMLMVITENLDELRQIEPVHFSENTDLSQRTTTISFFTSTSSVIPAMYKLIFGSYMPRINDDLKLLLQNSVENIGDSFCFKDCVVIKVYGFERESFKIPKFITRRLFVLEFLRQYSLLKMTTFLKVRNLLQGDLTILLSHLWLSL